MSKFEDEGGVYARVDFMPDVVSHTVKPETLVANTNLPISIPATARMVHVYNGTSSPIYFKLDQAWTAVPSAAYVVGGFLAPNAESARAISEGPIGSGHTVNLICASAGSVVVEFIG